MAKNFSIIADGIAGNSEGLVRAINETDVEGILAPIDGLLQRDSTKSVVDKNGDIKVVQPNTCAIDWQFGKAEIWLQPAETYTIDGIQYTTQKDFLTDFGFSQVIDSTSGILFLRGRNEGTENGTIRLTNGTNYLGIGFNGGNLRAEWNGGSINGGAFVDGAEYALAIKYNSGSIEFFVNGVSVGSGSYTPISADSLNELKAEGSLRFSKVQHDIYSTDITKL